MSNHTQKLVDVFMVYSSKVRFRMLQWNAFLSHPVTILLSMLVSVHKRVVELIQKIPHCKKQTCTSQDIKRAVSIVTRAAETHVGYESRQ